MISKSLSTSKCYASLNALAGPLAEFCQLLYPLLVAHADDFGRLEGDPFTIKFAVCPTSPRTESEVSTALECLGNSGLILWDGNVIQIKDFERHQGGLHKRTASRFPEVSRKLREIPSELKGTEQKGTEGNGRSPELPATRVSQMIEERRINPPPRAHSIVAKRRKDAAWEGPRVYVPQRAHTDFIGLRNHPGAEAELLTWYAEVSEAWTTGAQRATAIEADMFVFWRARFSERWPVAAKPSGRREPQWVLDARKDAADGRC